MKCASTRLKFIHLYEEVRISQNGIENDWDRENDVYTRVRSIDNLKWQNSRAGLDSLGERG